MVADDQVTSFTGVGGSAGNGAVAFATTHWSMVLEAQGDSAAAEAALEKLCRTYWRPIYGFVRRQSIEPEEAKDLTQGFFCCCWNATTWRLAAPLTEAVDAISRKSLRR